MGSEKPGNLLPGLLELPPRYDEATSSRPSSSQSFLGPAEISSDAERQTLLERQQNYRENNGYRPPTVESARSSLDGGSPSWVTEDSIDELRHEISEMDVLEPGESTEQNGTGSRLSKRIGGLRLSSLHLPFKRWLPSLRSVRNRLPPFPDSLKPNWILVIRVFALLLVLSVAYLLFFTGVFRFRDRYDGAYSPESVRAYMQTYINATRIKESLEQVTKWDHVSGTKGSYYVASWIRDEMEAAGLDAVELEQFDVYLNYPTKNGRRVAITDPLESKLEIKIEEEAAYPDRDQTMVFHGHSRSGTASGPLIYANYGSRDDFKKLEDEGVKVNGSVVLVRYYGSQGDRALKVKAAELAGAVGCIIYSDPKEDGFLKGEVFPNGRFRPSNSVQRGAVSLMSWVVGDVLSPGFASLPGEPKRISKDRNPGLNNIPSIPLSWDAAKPLLQALKGHGKQLTADDWKGGVPDVEWWTGDQASPTVLLQNEQDEIERRPIYNVLGKIQGIEQGEKSVIIGAHYDAWCFGATDPGSGTSVMLEVMRVLAELKRGGWQPRRTIEFAAWDGEEYNLIGSTEHVEARIEELRKNGFAYLNIDTAVVGDHFHASGSPILEKALTWAMKRVSDPFGNTLHSIWAKNGDKLGGLGAGSDYVAFQDLAGVSSLDLTFDGPAFPYHSCFDNFDLMSRVVDPEFVYHRMMAEVVGLLALYFADEPLLPFDLENYAAAVQGYIDDLKKYSEKTLITRDTIKLNFEPLDEAGKIFTSNAKEFNKLGKSLSMLVEAGDYEADVISVQRTNHNSKMADFETNLLDAEGGLPGREQFKHIVFAPQAWSGYEEAFFPGPRDAIDSGDVKAAQEQIEKAAGILRRASERLLQ